jgi:hypothetical protein
MSETSLGTSSLELVSEQRIESWQRMIKDNGAKKDMGAYIYLAPEEDVPYLLFPAPFFGNYYLASFFFFF